MSSTLVRNLRLDDIPVVVEMLQESFESRLRPFMTYTQHGIGDFLSIPLEYPESQADRTPLVVVRQHAVVGFADFRMLDPQTGHLSYICVKPSARGSGVATILISDFLRSHPHVTKLSLDVFRNNGPAQALYKKLGFTTMRTAGWVTRELPAPLGTVSIGSLAASMAAYRQHGFCELDVCFEQERINIGLLGPHVLRCFSVDSFEKDALLAALRQVFKHADRALAVVPEPELAGINVPHTVVTLTDRMILEVR